VTSHFFHRLIALALTLAVAAPIAPRELVVLCLGADGHVAFENASEACREHAEPCADDADSCSDGCGPCRDVQLITGEYAIGRPDDSTMLVPLDLLVAPAWSASPARDESARRLAAILSQPRAGNGISSRALVALLI